MSFSYFKHSVNRHSSLLLTGKSHVQEEFYFSGVVAKLVRAPRFGGKIAMICTILINPCLRLTFASNLLEIFTDFPAKKQIKMQIVPQNDE